MADVLKNPALYSIVSDEAGVMTRAGY